MSPPVRIPVPVVVPPQAVDHGVIDALASKLHSRDSSEPRRSKNFEIVAILLGAIVGIIILLFLFRHFYRRYSRSVHTYKPARHEEDVPTTRQINRQTQNDLEDALTEPQAQNGGGTTGDAGLNRNTSIRSVMTLPVYRQKATENELVLGREGERDGIDTVVEMRTAEEEEALRDEEMEAMYQIRATRRRQIAEREERRRQRREARDNSDVVALRELRENARSRASRNLSELQDLRQEHERIRETRQRAVSSVSYADVGIARADGTRIRANSTDSSERVGLLSDTASIAADSLFRRRDRSASATLSIDTSRTLHDHPDYPSGGALTTGGSGVYSLASAGRTRSRTNSGATTPRIPTPTATATTRSRAGSSPEIIDAEDADLGDVGIPPPDYDEVSLNEAITPLHSRRNSDVSARPASPYPDPPPDYPGPGAGSSRGSPGAPPGPAEDRNRRLSAHMGDLAAQTQAQAQTRAQQGASRHTTGTSSGVPRLPSLRLSQVPQIVIEPSSARP